MELNIKIKEGTVRKPYLYIDGHGRLEKCGLAQLRLQSFNLHPSFLTNQCDANKTTVLT